jgi:ABC-type branched-subunit amino acid transport system ATPase component
MAIGALVAIPAIRLSGLFLALATLGFGILVERLLYSQSWMFTTFSSGRAMPLPGFVENQKQFFYVVLAVVVLAAGLVVAVQRSRLGRVLQGLSGSPTAVAAMGLNVNVTKVVVFCLSAFVAGIAGVLLGCARGFAVAADPFYMSFNSLVLLAMLAIAPFAEPWYALVALAGVIPAYLTGEDTSTWLNVLFGVAAVVVSMQGGSPAMPVVARRVLDRLGGRRRGPRPPAVDPARASNQAGRTGDGAGLRITDLTVRFGGLVAVDGLGFDAPLGRITGLIGPNGAGKTTTFDAASGFTRPTAGAVRLHGAEVTRHSPSARGRLGLGRTFQRVELCDTLSVLQNVMLGVEAGAVGSSVAAHVLATPGRREAAEAAAWSALAACGVEDLAGRSAGTLSTGQERLVELARLLAGPFDVLLLDEPSSGLDEQETARFSALLQDVVAQRGVGILLVEHDVEMVMRVCDYIYVLDFGRLIFDGRPAEVAASPIVRAAYLGDDEVMAAVGTGIDEKVGRT